MFFVELYVTGNNIQLFRVNNYFIVIYVKNNNANYMYQFLKKNVFQPIFTLFTRYI